MKIILASQSPRRRELLERMGIFDFEVIPAQVEEILHTELPPIQLVEDLSRRKCAVVSANHPDDLVIAADTVVSIDNRVLGKPQDRVEAAEMLFLLSGREHTVYSGLTVCCRGRVMTEHEATAVRFRPLTTSEITDYINTGEPMDKAGAYGIQGYGSVLAESISGDYYNVMGLPVCRLALLLSQFGIDTLSLAAKKEQAK